MKLSSDCAGKKAYISLCSLFEFLLFIPGVFQRPETSSDVMLALTTGVLARKWDWDQITGWVAILLVDRRACSFSSSITSLFTNPPPAKFVPVCPLGSCSPISIQTFSNSCLFLYLIFSASFHVDFLFALWCFSKGGSLYIPSSPLQ